MWSRLNTSSITAVVSLSRAQNRRSASPDRRLLEKIVSPAVPDSRDRRIASSRAAVTLARISADGSPGFASDNSAKDSAGISIWMSIRSSIGPLIFSRYAAIAFSVHLHGCASSLLP